MLQVIPTFFTWLPIWEDEGEVPFVYDYLCDLVEANNLLVLGEDNANLPKLLEVILTPLLKGALDDDATAAGHESIGGAGLKKLVKARLIAIVKRIHVSPLYLRAV